jgi:hypothetical protein
MEDFHKSIRHKMRHKLIYSNAGIILGVLLWLLLVPVFSQAEDPKGGKILFDLLPSKSQLQDWQLDNKPQTAVGVKLYKLINGGAELYIKAGFKQAIMATYRNKARKLMYLEIYEMTSVKGAAGVFKQKIGKQGKKVSIGMAALLEDGFINFYQGPYQVTLSWDDTEAKTVNALLELARMVASRLSAQLQN